MPHVGTSTETQANAELAFGGRTGEGWLRRSAGSVDLFAYVHRRFVADESGLYLSPAEPERVLPLADVTPEQMLERELREWSAASADAFWAMEDALAAEEELDAGTSAGPAAP